MAFGKHKQNALAKEQMVAAENEAERNRKQAERLAAQQAATAKRNAALARKEQEQNAMLLEKMSDGDQPPVEYIDEREKKKRGAGGRSAFGLSQTRGLGGGRSVLG